MKLKICDYKKPCGYKEDGKCKKHKYCRYNHPEEQYPSKEITMPKKL